MRWLKVIILVILLSLIAYPVDAGTIITVSYNPKVSSGITGFTITYVNDKQLDFDWSYTTATKIMIRAKYSEYPADIPDEDTTPTDGYLVYYGDGVSASDTSMDFNQNLGILYIKAWGQKADGKWYTDTEGGYKESKQMELLFFLFLAVGLTYIGAKSTYWILKFMSGVAWFGLAAYWKANTPTSITAGSPTDTIIIVLLIVVGLAMFLMPFWYTKQVNGLETGKGFKLPFMNDEEENPPPPMLNHKQRMEQYRERVNRRMKGQQ